MGGCIIGIGFIFLVIGVVVLVASRKQDQPTTAGQSTAYQNRAASTPASVFTPASAGNTSVSLAELAVIKPGARISVQHPQRGEMTVHVDGRILFDELWQLRRGTNEPWVPNGNVSVGLWLEGNMLLLNWQNRIYLLDEREATSDVEIQNNFAEHARKFGQMDQQGEVMFAFPPTMWKMVDIGRFRVSDIQGSAQRMSKGGEGRFIHAHSSDKRALVVEDYATGGQDSIWLGYVLDREDVKE